MTIPTQMNCPHSGDGWCLSCLKSIEEVRQGKNRQGKKEELLELLKENLTISVVKGLGCTDPNTLVIGIYFDNELICQDSAWIRISPEYEG